MDLIVHVGRDSRCMERKHNEGIRGKGGRI